MREQVPTGIAPSIPRQSTGHAEERPWHDLAENRPGAAAHAQAVAAREAAPTRTLLARLIGVHTDERAWRLGARGERRVAAQLARLGPAWRVLHAVEVGDRGSDIDHVLVGPGGVFTLNAKHHPGARMWVRGDDVGVNGRRVPYVRNSRHEAARAARLLSEACRFPVVVTGVVVPIAIADLDVSRAPDDVLVIPRGALVRGLRRLPTVLEPATVEYVYDRARRSDTWHSQPAGWVGTPTLHG
ncbi:MAG: nuclease-related domain-containing protein [Sporichthyaceae bacterium]